MVTSWALSWSSWFTRQSTFQLIYRHELWVVTEILRLHCGYKRPKWVFFWPGSPLRLGEEFRQSEGPWSRTTAFLHWKPDWIVCIGRGISGVWSAWFLVPLFYSDTSNLDEPPSKTQECAGEIICPIWFGNTLGFTKEDLENMVREKEIWTSLFSLLLHGWDMDRWKASQIGVIWTSV